MFYIFLADGFEEIEALCPLDLMLRAGIEVKTVSINQTTLVRGAHNIKVEADMTLDSLELCSDTLCGVMLPGGLPGADNLFECDKVRQAVQLAYDEGKLVCAICAAPYILGEMGLLAGKEAICYPGFENRLHGAVISQNKVVCANNVITAKGMGVAFDFGIEIVKYFKGEAAAEALSKATMA